MLRPIRNRILILEDASRLSQLSTMAFSLTSLDKDFGYPAEYTFYFLTFLRQGCSAPRTYKTVLEHLHPLSRAYTELIV